LPTAHSRTLSAPAEDYSAPLPAPAEAERAGGLVKRLVSLLTGAKREVGELERFLVLMAIAARSLGVPMVRGENPAEIMPAARTNVLSIAESTGIPRETVRRKVRELLEMKLIFRSGQLLGLSGAGWRTIAPGLHRMACPAED